MARAAELGWKDFNPQQTWRCVSVIKLQGETGRGTIILPKESMDRAFHEN